MQNTASSSNPGAIISGIAPPPMYSLQSQYMQSTTPSAPNGKEEMRGWLYKWTNVNTRVFAPDRREPCLFLPSRLVSERLPEALVRSPSGHSLLLPFAGRNDAYVPRHRLPRVRSSVVGRLVSLRHLERLDGDPSAYVQRERQATLDERPRASEAESAQG